MMTTAEVVAQRELPLEIGGPKVVETREVVKRFGGETALDGMNLQVPEGAVYVLVGPNGAGKSTTFRMLIDLVRPDSGEVSVMGLDPAGAGPRIRARTGYIPEKQEWGYRWMRVGRLLEHHALHYPSWDRGYAERLVRTFDLKLERKVAKLSKGQGRRVHLTLALAHRPPLLVLDEPFDGLDPVVLDDTLGILAEHIAETPTTVLISTHQIHDVDRLADHVGVMREGRLIVQAPREDLHQKLRRYRTQVPDGWSMPVELSRSVLRSGSFGREKEWSIWGEEGEVAASLGASGAELRDVKSLSLSEAAVTLLGRKESQ